jgi:threonine aldolase
MFEAEVGDDVWGEDPTVHRLERLAAEITGKEAALFVTSGTQGNLIGLLAHTRHGDEVIVGNPTHIFLDETAGTAVVGGIQLYPLPVGASGCVDPDDVKAAIRSGADFHNPRTAAVAIENTHQATSGKPIGRERIAAVAAVTRSEGLKVHIDGARLFHAVVALNTPAHELLAEADSVTFCLSKGLGAPAGSVLCGEATYIERARRWRKMLGGGMRQAGVLAAAGLVALEEGIERLAEDHRNAKLLAEGLSRVPGIRVEPSAVETNILFFETDGDPTDFVRLLASRGVRVATVGARVRAVTSYEVSRADVEYAVESAWSVAAALAPAIA